MSVYKVLINVRKEEVKGMSDDLSIHISQIIQYFEYVTKEYEYNFENVNKQDRLTQDYLHMLELDNLNYSERAKVATKVSKCRKERRASKDLVEALTPLVTMITSERGVLMLNLLKEVLGKTRKIEKQQSARTYKFKVYSDEEYTE